MGDTSTDKTLNPGVNLPPYVIRLERELASLRQKQVLWEAGNRELADRLEARDVAIDALRAEKERAEREVVYWRDQYYGLVTKMQEEGNG